MKKTANNDSNGAIQENVRIGSQIRDLRKSKGITMSVMAEKIGKSVGYISQVERGVSSLPIPILQSISEVLGVQITWFFHTDNPVEIDELNYIVRKNARRHLNFAGTGISEELLTPRLSGNLLMILTTLAPRAKSDKSPRKRKGEEAGYIQSGTLELTIGNKQFTLQQGDSFSIAGSEPHFVHNPSPDQDAVLVWTLTPGQY